MRHENHQQSYLQVVENNNSLKEWAAPTEKILQHQAKDLYYRQAAHGNGTTKAKYMIEIKGMSVRAAIDNSAAQIFEQQTIRQCLLYLTHRPVMAGSSVHR